MPSWQTGTTLHFLNLLTIISWKCFLRRHSLMVTFNFWRLLFWTDWLTYKTARTSTAYDTAQIQTPELRVGKTSNHRSCTGPEDSEVRPQYWRFFIHCTRWQSVLILNVEPQTSDRRRRRTQHKNQFHSTWWNLRPRKQRRRRFSVRIFRVVGSSRSGSHLAW
jgi:hypothetical protein